MILSNRLIGRAAAIVALASAVAPAMAQTVPFGCYERIYPADHLAKNPAQTVRRISVEISKFEGDPDVGMAASVGVIAQFKNDRRQWAAGGGCKAEGGALVCGMDGDAGQAVVRVDAQALRLEIPSQVSVEGDLPNGDLDHRAIRGPAHRVFVLVRASKAACTYKR